MLTLIAWVIGGTKTDMIINKSRTATKIFYCNPFGQALKLSNKPSFGYKMKRCIYTHKKCSDFHKVIVPVSKTNNEPLPLFFVQFYCKDKEHEIDFTSPCHRNNLSKEKPRQIMFPSVRNEVKSLVSEKIKRNKYFENYAMKLVAFQEQGFPLIFQTS